MEKLIDAMNECGGTVECFVKTQLGNSAQQKVESTAFFKTAAFSSSFVANYVAVRQRLQDAERTRVRICSARTGAAVP